MYSVETLTRITPSGIWNILCVSSLFDFHSTTSIFINRIAFFHGLQREHKRITRGTTLYLKSSTNPSLCQFTANGSQGRGSGLPRSLLKWKSSCHPRHRNLIL